MKKVSFERFRAFFSGAHLRYPSITFLKTFILWGGGLGANTILCKWALYIWYLLLILQIRVDEVEAIC